MTIGDVQNGSVLAASSGVIPAKAGTQASLYGRDTSASVYPLPRDWAPSCDGVTRVGGAILVGGSGKDTITGSKGHDLIIGGDSADAFVWSGGNDLVFGGKGDDNAPDLIARAA